MYLGLSAAFLMIAAALTPIPSGPVSKSRRLDLNPSVLIFAILFAVTDCDNPKTFIAFELTDIDMATSFFSGSILFR